MSSSEIALRLRGLSKAYTITHNQAKHSTLGEAMLDRLRHPLRRHERETFWALDDVSLEVRKGDAVGIIGRNGAGKSTLLKVLSRITEPTRGEVDLWGRVGSLLEVGTGFHPELTGRENIYLNGHILGMRKKEIDRQFDGIVDFAGVERFLDTPIKRYSSGMYVRLAFAVAAHLNPEILLIDEVLAVGDLEFQRKCLGKMKDVANSGRTVLFVSHHMQSVAVLCNRAVYMQGGKVTYCGEVAGAIERYTASFARTAPSSTVPERRPGSGEFRFVSVVPSKEYFDCGEEKIVSYTIERRKPFAGSFFVSCLLIDSNGLTVAHCDSRMVGHWVEAEGDLYEGRFTLRTPWLKPGDYRLEMYICNAGIVDKFEEACRLHVLPLLPYPAAGNSEATAFGVVFADFSYEEAGRTGAAGSAALRTASELLGGVR